MLTADLVQARRKGDELRIARWDENTKHRAAELASQIASVVQAHLGADRDAVTTAIAAVPCGAREQRLKDGLAKLVLDHAEWDSNEELDPEAVRREVFTLASRTRAEQRDGEPFDRERILDVVAAARETSKIAIERALFADLRGSHVLLSANLPPAGDIASGYELEQAKAVLLRAEKVTVDFEGRSAAALRDVFRRLKFLQLLYTLERTEKGHRAVIDGPFTLFDSVTKYGLRLAQLVPALETCGPYELVANVRWGKERTPLLFRWEGGNASSHGAEESVAPEVLALAQGISALGTGFEVSLNREVLELPGVGLVVPDLVFQRMDGRKVYLEVLGYWSRDAVWKRVELAQKGLEARVLFAVSARLRVSEEVLPGDALAALYVYKGVMSHRAVAERVGRLADR